MQLELEDLVSGRRYPLDTESVIGRDRARTDITLTDDAISKRHARVFCEEGAWYLEDLGSSNGSFLGSVRVDKRAPLAPGDEFRLAELRFALVEARPSQRGPTTAPERMTSTVADPASSASDDRPAPLPSTTVHRAHPGPALGGPTAEPEPEPGILATAGAALRFYLRATPRMAINPFGDIRRVIQEQPLQPKEDLELATFAGVAGLLSGLLYTAAAGTRGALPAVFSLVASLLVAAIAALLGLFSHRLLRRLVEALGGDCSPRTRTNALLSGWVLSILATAPAAVALLRPWLDGYAGLLGPALSLLTAVVGMFWLWSWAGYFDLKPWARYTIFGLGLAGVGSAGAALVLSVTALSAPVAPPAAVAKSASPAKPAAPVPAAAARRLPAEAVASKGEPQPPKAPGQAPGAAPSPPPRAPSKAAKAPAAKAQQPGPGEAVAGKPASGQPAAQPASGAAVEARRGAAVADEQVAAAPTPFARYAAQRAQIEEALDADPGLLSRDRRLRRRYERLCREEHKIQQRFAKQAKRASPWEQAKILPRLQAAQRFERTRALVRQVHAQLPGR